MVLITLLAGSAALCFSIEAILIKWMCERGVDGAAGSYLVLFFDGVYGIVMLTVLTATGGGLTDVESKDFITTFIGGILTGLAIVCVNYGV